MRLLKRLPLLVIVFLAGAGTARGEQLAYRATLNVDSSDCLLRFDHSHGFKAIVGQIDGRDYFLLPEAQPEHAIVGPIFYNDAQIPVFSSLRRDSFPAESVGTLNLSKQLTLTFSSDKASFSGTLSFNNAPVVFAEIKPEHTADAKLLGESGCNLVATLQGQRVTAATVDPTYHVRVWELLKAHTNHVTKMEPDASIPPLLEGLALPGAHHVEFLWRLSRAYFLQGEQAAQSAKTERLASFQQAIDYAQKALDIDPEHGEAAFFLAAGTGRYNTTKGFLKTLVGLEKFEQLCLKSIQNGSKYNLFGFTVIGDAHHALGQFYRLVPDSAVIKMLLGTRGNIDKSIHHHRISVEQQFDRGDYLKELGVSLLCKYADKRDEALLREAAKLFGEAERTATWAFDNPELDKQHMRKLLEKPSDACSYSRDNYN